MRGWLTGEVLAITQDLGRAAALGLATWADRRGQLSERTQTALLEAAEQTKDAQLLVPLSRLSRLSDAVGAHLLEVAGHFFSDAQGSARRHAILALGSAGESAAEPLGQVLLGNHYSVQERTAAVQALARLGEAGQKQLDQLVTRLLSRGLPGAATEPLWIPLISALTALKSPQHVRGELRKLSNVILPDTDRPGARAQRRRLVWLKCRAADLLYNPGQSSVALAQCDPERGRPYWLALLSALSRQSIAGPQLDQFNAALDQTDVVVRQAALRLLVTHREIPGKKSRLLAALLGPDPGSVTLAAQLIHTYPESIQEGKVDNTAEVSAALGHILSKGDLPEEARAAALRAAGSLGALNLKSLIEQACAGKNQLLWTPAQYSLRMLGQGHATCPSSTTPTPSAPAASPIGPLPQATPQAPVIVQIESDIGPLELHLDPNLAPQAVTHLLAQVDAGFYNHQRIIFGRPGLSVQFGDKNEDGYDDVGAPGLPFEISPAPFEQGSVGMSSFAPGAENTQLFVTVSDAPQLFGSRILLGQAKGPWELLVFGDELQSVRRLTK
jgi:cyclophilin family peptidyl-prolyl cis-trans isomerase